MRSNLESVDEIIRKVRSTVIQDLTITEDKSSSLSIRVDPVKGKFVVTSKTTQPLQYGAL